MRRRVPATSRKEPQTVAAASIHARAAFSLICHDARMRADVIAALHSRRVSRGRTAGRESCLRPYCGAAAAAEKWPVADVLAGRGITPVSYAEWLRIETAEADPAGALGRGAGPGRRAGTSASSRTTPRRSGPDHLSWVVTPLIRGVTTHDNECIISVPYASEMADAIGEEVTYSARRLYRDGVSGVLTQRRPGPKAAWRSRVLQREIPRRSAPSRQKLGWPASASSSTPARRPAQPRKPQLACARSCFASFDWPPGLWPSAGTYVLPPGYDQPGRPSGCPAAGRHLDRLARAQRQPAKVRPSRVGIREAGSARLRQVPRSRP